MDQTTEIVSLETLKADERIELLPDDVRWLRELLQHKSPANTHKLLRRYRDTWLVYAHDEPVSYKKQNAGRYAANTWIRKEVKGS